jgi:hypothetical protein
VRLRSSLPTPARNRPQSLNARLPWNKEGG